MIKVCSNDSAGQDASGMLTCAIAATAAPALTIHLPASCKWTIANASCIEKQKHTWTINKFAGGLIPYFPQDKDRLLENAAADPAPLTRTLSTRRSAPVITLIMDTGCSELDQVSDHLQVSADMCGKAHMHHTGSTDCRAARPQALRAHHASGWRLTAG